MAYEQHIHQHTHKQHNNHRRNFWPMYSGAGSYGSGHPNNQNNHQSSAEHFLQSSQASTFLQELIDCNRKRGPMVTGSGNHLRNPPLPHPPPPQSGNPDPRQQPNSGAPVGANGQQQQPPMSDANANLNNEHWNFMGPKMGQWGDKNGVAGSAAPVGGPNGNQQLEDDFRLEYMVEYMELDEFLTENDIPLESVLHDQPQNLDDDPKQSRNNSVSKPMGPPSMVPSPASNSVGTDSNSGSSQIKTECVNNQQPPGNLSGLDGSRLDRSPYDQSPSPQQQQTNGQDFSNLTQLQSATQPGPLCDKGGHVISLPPPAPLGPPGPPRSPLDQESESGEHGMSNAALLRKRKKQMVMDERKDEKYWERRRKNNMAAKRSRDARRAKETQIAIQASILERENKNLTTELSKARAENLLLRERLQKYEPV